MLRLSRIAVVDNEADIALVTKKALENEGYAVEAFSDPSSALDSIAAGGYNLLITDIRMPNMNGFQLYREAKKRDQHIKVAFMSAFEIYKDEFKRYLPNIDEGCFFTKPMRMNDLVERVRRKLAGSS